MEPTMEVEGQSNLPVIANPVVVDFDLYSYASRYDGHTKLERLHFIAQRCSNLQAEAYKQLILELKKGINTNMYTNICDEVKSSLGPQFAIDIPWMEVKEKEAIQRLERLDSELLSAKTTMVKESIRLGYTFIGHFHCERGNFTEAMKSYVRSRDYCTMPAHHSEMCINVIAAALELNQNKHAIAYITKADTGSADSATLAKAKAASGIVALGDNHYQVAGKHFVEVTGDLGGHFSNVIAAEDVALYGTMCALATFDRAELRRYLFEKSSFKTFLELTPEIRSLAQDFFSGAYGKCLISLEALRPLLLLDIHLAAHADHLIGLITDRVILQYFLPYAAVDLNKMAAALHMDPTILEKKIASLISRDQMSARIDSGTKTLHRRNQDDRQVSIDKVLRLAAKHGTEVKRTILRLSLLQNGFVVSSKDSPLTSRADRSSSSSTHSSSTHLDAGDGTAARGGTGTYRQGAVHGNAAMSVEDGGEERHIVGGVGGYGGYVGEEDGEDYEDDGGDEDDEIERGGSSVHVDMRVDADDGV